MRAAVKEDLGCSSAEMALGTQLRLPGQLFVEEEGPSQTEYRKHLTEFMATLRPTPLRECTNPRAYVDSVIAPSFFILIICRCWASNTFIFPIFCSNQKKAFACSFCALYFALFFAVLENHFFTFLHGC